MFTRNKKSQALFLLQAIKREQETVANMRQLRSHGTPTTNKPLSVYEKQERRAKIELKKQKRLMSSRRRLKWGEKRQIIIKRFGSLGSLEPTAQSYG